MNHDKITKKITENLSTTDQYDIWDKLTPTDADYMMYSPNPVGYNSIAAVGLKQGDIEILTEGETLRVKYEKKDSEYNNEYIHRGITRRSFDFAWKISSDLNISKAGATMKDGLLRITIPYAVDRAPKRIAIK